jgi:hypothetical protein
MNNTNNSILRPTVRGLILALAVFALSSQVVRANPYACMVTNTGGGTIQFYLNEGGGNVTVTYEDNSIDATFNGAVRAAGAYTFSLGAHTSYSIQVAKTGSGSPSLIASSPAFPPRGMDVNRSAASPYFGCIYVSKVSSPNGIYAFHPDWSVPGGSPSAGGVAFQAGNVFEPYRIYVADDDYLMVGDGGYDNAGVTTLQDGVWRLTPDLTSSQLFLGPAGEGAGSAAGVHTAVISRPWVIGNVQSGNPVVLLDVDGDFAATHGYNSLLVYSNITLAALPYQSPPTIQGPEIGLNITDRSIQNVYPGLQIGKTGPSSNYIYCSTGRGNYSNPNVQIYTNDLFNPDTTFNTSATLALVWDSITADGGTVGVPPGPDFYANVSDANGANTDYTADIGISPDGKYLACLIRRNWFVITPLTNGLPDTAHLFKSAPTSGTTIARGMCWDAADNLYLGSSGLGLCQSWSLGQTAIATTTGNASGSTGFKLSVPSAHVSVTATTPNASQGGVNGTPGTPVPGVFTITRTDVNGYASPLAVNFTLGGTAPAAAYASSSGTPAVGGAITIPANQQTVTVTITPSTANVPRPTTTVVLTVSGGTYVVDAPTSGTVLIQNTSANQLVVTAGAPTMYKAFSNDFASVTITRIGDTNVAAYTTTAYTYSGTALVNVDFTPLAVVTFNPGDLVYVPTVNPLSNGVAPVDVSNPTYVGNKTVTVTLPATGSYLSVAPSNATTMTLIDNAELPNTVLFSDPLTDPADATHWAITYASGNLTQEPSDYNVDFGWDITTGNGNAGTYGTIPLPPSGATTALRITCNKQQPGGATYAGGVNVYYTNQAFSGNYAVRFNMNVVAGDNSFIVEGPLFGINHNGLETNWWLGSTANYEPHIWASDGVWYWIQTPPGGYGGFAYIDFQEYTGAGGALPNTGWQNPANVAAMPNVYKHAVFTAPGGLSGGTPANNSPVSVTPADSSWSDVELKQVNNVVTMSIDKTPIFYYTNATHFTNGYIMLGYNSPLGGAFNNYLATPDAAVYVSNLRVVSLTRPVITGTLDSKVGNNNNVTISFVSFDGDDTAGSFALQSAATVNGTYADVGGATITQVLNPSDSTKAFFQATTTSTSVAQFYRIRHL